MSATTKDNAAAGAAAKTETWTHGNVIGARLISGLLVTAVLCGPLALGAAGYLIAFPPRTATTATDTTTALDSEQQRAGDFASDFVAAWLTATREDSTALAAYVQTSNVSLPNTATNYRDLAVTSITPADGADLVTVTTAATIDSGESGWIRRYFDVVVSVSPKGYTVLGMPAPVSAPVYAADGAQPDYSTSVPSSSPPGKSVQAFLSAYLAGDGDLSRILSPGSDLAPITPAPYSAATVTAIAAHGDIPPAKPTDGTTARVRAQVRLAAGDESTAVTATYSLTLKARADRWEISSIDPAPALADTKH